MFSVKLGHKIRVPVLILIAFFSHQQNPCELSQKVITETDKVLIQSGEGFLCYG